MELIGRHTRFFERPINIPGLKGGTSLTEQGEAVMNALSEGEITPSEASTVMGVIQGHTKIIEFSDLEACIKVLEERAGK